MTQIWSGEARVRRERRLWVAVLRAQRELGVPVPAGAVEAYEAAVERVDLASIAERERRSLHDVKARIEEFNALAGYECVHLGMTSRDLTELVERELVAEALGLVVRKAAAALLRMAVRIEAGAAVVLTARTHHVPAQATTVGRRLAMFAEELLLAARHAEGLCASLPRRGLTGAVGTQLDVLTLLGGDGARVDALDDAVAEHLGPAPRLLAAGQVYPRSLDFEVVAALFQIACGPASFATTLRLMAGLGLATEGFAEGQTGSSAMPHKMNARNCERLCGLRDVLSGHVAMAAANAGRQWNEGDVSCSVVRRVVLPDAFLAADSLLETLLAILDRMAFFPAAIAAENRRELPYLATTTLLMEAVRRGTGRERAHERIKHHAVGARRDEMEGRTGPGLLERLQGDPDLPFGGEDLWAWIGDGARLAGRAAEQARRLAVAARDWAAGVPGAADVQPGPLL